VTQSIRLSESIAWYVRHAIRPSTLPSPGPLRFGRPSLTPPPGQIHARRHSDHGDTFFPRVGPNATRTLHARFRGRACETTSTPNQNPRPGSVSFAHPDARRVIQPRVGDRARDAPTIGSSPIPWHQRVRNPLLIRHKNRLDVLRIVGCSPHQVFRDVGVDECGRSPPRRSSPREQRHFPNPTHTADQLAPFGLGVHDSRAPSRTRRRRGLTLTLPRSGRNPDLDERAWRPHACSSSAFSSSPGLWRSATRLDERCRCRATIPQPSQRRPSGPTPPPSCQSQRKSRPIPLAKTRQRLRSATV